MTKRLDNSVSTLISPISNDKGQQQQIAAFNGKKSGPSTMLIRKSFEASELLKKESDLVDEKLQSGLAGSHFDFD